MTIKRRKCGSCLKTRNGSNFLDDDVFACNKCLFPKKVCKSCGVGREISIKKCVNEHCVLHLRKYHLKKKNDFNDFKNRLYNNCNTRIINFGIQIYSRLKLKSQNFLLANDIFNDVDVIEIKSWMSNISSPFTYLNFDDQRRHNRYITSFYYYCFITIIVQRQMRRLVTYYGEVLAYHGTISEGLVIPSCLKSFLDMLSWWHGPSSALVAAQLLSLPFCHEQKQHEDNVYAVEGRRFFGDIPFSIIIALEDNTNRTCIVDCNGIDVVITKGSAVIFRGNYRHSGASYSTLNSRLHIAVCHHEKLKYLDDVYNVATK